MRSFKRVFGGTITVVLTIGLLALGIGLIAGRRQVALGAIATTWGAWSVLMWFVAGHGSDRFVTATLLLRPFATGTLLLALAVVIIVVKESLDWVVILPLSIAWIILGVALVWIYYRRPLLTIAVMCEHVCPANQPFGGVSAVSARDRTCST